MELTEAERAVLVDLLALMIAADGKTSAEELTEVLELGDEFGVGELLEQVAEAEGKPRAAILAAAETIERHDARSFMRTVLHDLAAVDGIHDAEQALLDELARLWP